MDAPTETSRKCYVLGAGFSHACGLPLARDLTRTVYKHTFDDPNIAALNNAAERRIRHMRFFFERCDCENIWPDFEQLLSFVDEYLDYAADFAQAGGVIPPLAPTTDLKASLIRGLMIMLAERSKNTAPATLQAVERFATRACDGRAGIISFNWDCLIEMACQRGARQVTYTSDVPNQLRLLKPHGSVNLVEPFAQKYDTEYAPAVNVRNIRELERAGDRVVLQAEDPFDAANRTLYPFAMDDWLVVPPGARKSFDSPWIKKQWKFALDMLRSAGEITVIGYSLPEFDIRSRLLFRLAVVRKAHADAPTVRIIDPSPGPIVEGLTALGYNRIECIARPWQDWLTDESRQINSG